MQQTTPVASPNGFPTAVNHHAAPSPFHVMLKPTGAICNLACEYCFFLSKEMLYPGSRFRMADNLLETYIKQYLASQHTPEVTFAWQGGEPTLMGLDFFKRAIELQQKLARPGTRIHNTVQTNGTKLDDDWGAFLAEHNFLVGLSIDGPRELHDAYRVDKGGRGSFNQVMGGLTVLKKHGVDFNLLCTVHAANGDHGQEVYRFFRDELEAEFMQFIPIIERVNTQDFDGVIIQEGTVVSERSVTGRQYGQFLIDVFDEWVRHDVGRVFVQIFDVALGAWLGHEPALCIFRQTCGEALALEHNGDLYSCDHFVEPKHKLGNIMEIPLLDLATSKQQQAFGQHKLDTLPNYCRSCDVRFVCNGGCPKNRFIEMPEGEPGLNYLCEGYKAFFRHIDLPMRLMARALQHGQPATKVMQYLTEIEQQSIARPS